MSGKQDKRLRRAALGLAVSVDHDGEGGRKIHERGLIETKHTLPNPSYDYRPLDRGDVMLAQHTRVQEHVYAVTVKNRPDSLRGIIRTIKKGIKKGAVGKVPSGF